MEGEGRGVEGREEGRGGGKTQKDSKTDRQKLFVRFELLTGVRIMHRFQEGKDEAGSGYVL